MLGLYIGIGIIIIGGFMHIVMNRNVEVPASGDFCDMPVRIKVAIIFFIIGVLLVCASVMFMLITDPVGYLK